jgi:hypothetical protein
MVLVNRQNSKGYFEHKNDKSSERPFGGTGHISEWSSKVKNDFMLSSMCKNIGIYVTESTIDDL